MDITGKNNITEGLNERIITGYHRREFISNREDGKGKNCRTNRMSHNNDLRVPKGRFNFQLWDTVLESRAYMLTLDRI